MSISNLLVPAPFLAIHLTNRRYGPAYAFAQIVMSFAVLAVATVFGGDAVRGLLPSAAAPLLREAVAFAAAFVLSGFLAIVAFDGARGPRWWTAPLMGSAVGAVSFAPLFYVGAYAGTNTPWVDHMLVEAAVLCGGAVAMLLPFWMLRRVVQPLPGYGGF
jgi:uncharacterized PurR-regulated membrane protein YhhQ (DUF165 family)